MSHELEQLKLENMALRAMLEKVNEKALMLEENLRLCKEELYAAREENKQYREQLKK